MTAQRPYIVEAAVEESERFDRLTQLVTDLDRTLTELPLPELDLYDEIEQSILNARRAVDGIEGRLYVAMMQERNELRKAAHTLRAEYEGEIELEEVQKALLSYLDGLTADVEESAEYRNGWDDCRGDVGRFFDGWRTPSD